MACWMSPAEVAPARPVSRAPGEEDLPGAHRQRAAGRLSQEPDQDPPPEAGLAPQEEEGRIWPGQSQT